MCARNSCTVIVAGVLIWLAFDLAVVALFAPFWFTFEVSDLQYSKGLALECVEPFSNDDRECDWTLDEDWADARKYARNVSFLQ